MPASFFVRDMAIHVMAGPETRLLNDFPRTRLAHLPTPLEPLPRLSQQLGGPALWVKRDDCTGLATGGNKTRKLEFALGEALAQGADTIITTGAVQSNHVRQTAAAAARLGLDCEVLLEWRDDAPGELFLESGNILLDRLFGATLRVCSPDTDFDAALAEAAAAVAARGGEPYVIPVGASNPVGALGYVHAALEVAGQIEASGLGLDRIVLATGSGGTQAGLCVGLAAAGVDIPVLGICVSRPRAPQEALVYELAVATAELIGRPGLVERDAVVANDEYVGAGYGVPTPAMNAALLQLARREGLLVDPVYTGKALAGLIDLIGRGDMAGDDNVLFLHTGGAPALFAYADELEL